MVKIMKKTKDGTYLYVSKDGGETLLSSSALKVKQEDAMELVKKLKEKNDDCEYFIV